MDTFTLVRPEHLNHFGNLFGGQMLKWVDEFAWLVATREFPGCALVTRAMDRVEFRKGVSNGSILRFHVICQKRGDTAVTYGVTVFAQKPQQAGEELVFANSVTFVAVDDKGRKVTLPPASEGCCR